MKLDWEFIISFIICFIGLELSSYGAPVHGWFVTMFGACFLFSSRWFKELNEGIKAILKNWLNHFV